MKMQKSECKTAEAVRADIIDVSFSTLIRQLIIVVSLVCLCQGAERELTIANSRISVTLDSSDATFSVTDKRTGQTWRQKATDRFKVPFDFTNDIADISGRELKVLIPKTINANR